MLECGMPCADIREIIKIHFGVDERLSQYNLRKNTCGAEVGSENLLIELVHGLGPEEIIDFSPAKLPDFLDNPDDTLEFLSFKHLFALQAALRVYTGVETGDRTATCSVSSIVNDFAGVEFTGVLDSAPLLEKIKSCGHCGSCGIA